MRPKKNIAAVVALALGLGSLSSVAFSFEETTIGSGQAKSPAAEVLETPKELPKAAPDPGKELKLTTPELQLAPGTEVRIPGVGKVGVLPKLDFGLELLYGNEQKGVYSDKGNPDDVQLRGTIKHRF